MSNNKSAFLLYYDYEETFNALPDPDRGALLSALFAYEKRGELPAFTGNLALIFPLFKNNLDRDRDKWTEVCESKRAEINRENGRKGGAPPGNQNARKTTENNQKNNRKTTEFFPPYPPDEDEIVNEVVFEKDVDDETVRGFFSSSLVVDCPPLYSYGEYRAAGEQWNHSDFAKLNFKTLSIVHNFWDRLCDGKYRNFEKPVPPQVQTSGQLPPLRPYASLPAGAAFRRDLAERYYNEQSVIVYGFAVDADGGLICADGFGLDENGICRRVS